MNWSTSRFCIDLILSSLILIPLSFWIYGLTEIFVITKRDENLIEEKTL
jgi:hypothetical protein